MNAVKWHPYRKIYQVILDVLVDNVNGIAVHSGGCRIGWVTRWRVPGMYWVARLVEVQFAVIVHKLDIEYQSLPMSGYGKVGRVGNFKDIRVWICTR